MKIGRNDPCPCGSGKKYKKCCLNRGAEEGVPNPAEEIMAEIREELEGRQFSSLAEAQAAMDGITRRQNHRPQDSFCGLSPDQMHRLLDFPFESEGLVTFSDKLSNLSDVPIMQIFSLLASALSDSGLKATAKGNLPLKFCREASRAYWGEKKYKEQISFSSIRTELDLPDLHTTRLVARLAGLIRKYRGRFLLTLKGEGLSSETFQAECYLELFRTYNRKFNWAYRDLYPPLHIVQNSFLYSLFLLQRFGEDWRPRTFYAEKFIRAFPMALQEGRETPYRTAEDEVGHCFSLRTWERFAEFLGLAEIRKDQRDRLSLEYDVRMRPLLRELLVFQF